MQLLKASNGYKGSVEWNRNERGQQAKKNKTKGLRTTDLSHCRSTIAGKNMRKGKIAEGWYPWGKSLSVVTSIG